MLHTVGPAPSILMVCWPLSSGNFESAAAQRPFCATRSRTKLQSTDPEVDTGSTANQPFLWNHDLRQCIYC